MRTSAAFMAPERTSGRTGTPGPAGVEAVLLDAHGTLLELQPPGPLLCAELARRYGLELTLAQAEHAIAAEIAYYRAHHSGARDAATLAALRAQCAEVLRDALPAGARPAGSLVEALLASLRFAPFADVRPALAALRAAGARLVVVSDWDVSLHGVLDELGLTPMLDGVVTSAEVGAGKPAAALFERALALVDVPAERAVHVGDSLELDVAGARGAGIEPVLIQRGGGAPRPGVRTIATLGELLGGSV
jgi:putative hydrolase of the HAD superfamily